MLKESCSALTCNTGARFEVKTERLDEETNKIQIHKEAYSTAATSVNVTDVETFLKMSIQ